MKNVDPVIQDAMDRLRRIEWDLGLAEQTKTVSTATRCFSGLVETLHRMMMNQHGMDVPVLPDSFFVSEPVTVKSPTHKELVTNDPDSVPEPPPVVEKAKK